jgi:hypothetical protein
LVVVLISVMIHGLKPGRVCRIPQALQIDLRTLKRWRQWWLDSFVRSSFGKAAWARFMPPLCESTLPLSLWLSFELEERQRLLAVLQFLGPITIKRRSIGCRILRVPVSVSEKTSLLANPENARLVSKGSHYSVQSLHKLCCRLAGAASAQRQLRGSRQRRPH